MENNDVWLVVALVLALVAGVLGAAVKSWAVVLLAAATAIVACVLRF